MGKGKCSGRKELQKERKIVRRNRKTSKEMATVWGVGIRKTGIVGGRKIVR